ncbi:hypothetical protein [Brevundimonas sp. SGAir0440]|uniref:hypothetical protein n=1 Tax=Brevundimonas sp. SGAir0440 TaxID=2579977 RepID=UPI0010CD59ED|nr:hypothetical protein [Brevundimonas sp. SGAir0440]QCQ98507.1 hypothetical protein E7T10_07420 [Brevundimonas sp. SGAir0440]
MTTATVEQARAVQAPSGAIKIAAKNSDAVVYVYTNAVGALCAMGFAGRRIKPDFRIRYGSALARERAVTTYFASAAGIAARKAEKKAKRAGGHSLTVGHILCASWGYEQTNVDWYEVARVTTSSVEVRKIKGNVTTDGGDRGQVVPMAGEFVGEPLLRRVGEYGVRIDSVRTATLWNGRPVYWSAYH